MLWIGPVSVVLLVHMRTQEHREQRLTMHGARGVGVSAAPSSLEPNSLVHPR